MAKSLILEVTIFDNETGEVLKKIIKSCETSYGYDVERLFSRIGEEMATVVDPNYGG